MVCEIELILYESLVVKTKATVLIQNDQSIGLLRSEN